MTTVTNGRTAVVVPSRDCADTTDRVVVELMAQSLRVFVVDDGSVPPLTLPANPGLTVIRHPVAVGLGGAIAAGVTAARREGRSIIITLDGDGQHSPADVPRIVSALQSADLVIGDRFSKNHLDIPTPKLASNFVGSFICSRELGVELRDVACGLRGFRVDVWPLAGLSAGYGMPFELLVTAVRRGLRIKSVPVDVTYPPHELWATRRAEMVGLVDALSALPSLSPEVAALVELADGLLASRRTFEITIGDTDVVFHSVDRGGHYLIQADPRTIRLYYERS